MANNVTTNVEFIRINEAGKEKLQELYSHIKQNGGYEWFSNLWNMDEEISSTYDWNVENVGSKWCYFDERGDDYFRVISAWSYPESGIRWLVEQIAEADPEVLVRVVYDDEMPNFFGAALYNADGIIDEREWDSEQIQSIMKERMEEHQDLTEGSDEYIDAYYYSLWEMVHETQEELIKEILDSLNESEE